MKCAICSNATKTETTIRTTDMHTICIKDYNKAASYLRTGLFTLEEAQAAHETLRRHKLKGEAMIRHCRREARFDEELAATISETEHVASRVAREQQAALVLFRKNRSCLEPEEHMHLIDLGLAALAQYNDHNTEYALFDTNPGVYRQCCDIYWNDIKVFE